jgi:hypothetical protein
MKGKDKFYYLEVISLFTTILVGVDFVHFVSRKTSVLNPYDDLTIGVLGLFLFMVLVHIEEKIKNKKGEIK